MSELVFVYGTLRQGDCRHGVTSFEERVHSEAYLSDFQMLHLGGFPGIVPGDGRIRGEVHSYEHFDVLDGIEGFYEENPEDSLYLRQKVKVEIPGLPEPIEVSTYVLNEERGVARRSLPVVESGDWFEAEPGRVRSRR